MGWKDGISAEMRAKIARFEPPTQGRTPSAEPRASTPGRAASMSTPATVQRQGSVATAPAAPPPQTSIRMTSQAKSLHKDVMAELRQRAENPQRPALSTTSSMAAAQIQRQASVASTVTPPVRPYSEIKSAKRKEKQELALALATKKDLDNRGALWTHAISEMKGRLLPMPARPMTAIAIPNPWAPRQVMENGEERYGRSKLKLFRKWNQEHISTQKQAHEEAEVLRDQAHLVRAHNESSKQAHELGQQASNKRYVAGAVAQTGSAAASIATATGGADGFTSAISVTANVSAALLQRRGEKLSRQAGAKMGEAIEKLTPEQQGSDLGKAMRAIQSGHEASARISKRARNMNILNAVVASSGGAAEYAAMPGASQRILTANGSPVADQAPSGGAWDMNKPTAFTLAETVTDAAQDNAYRNIGAATRSTRESQKKAGSMFSRLIPPSSASTVRYSAKTEQQKAAKQEIDAYKAMKQNAAVQQDSKVRGAGRLNEKMSNPLYNPRAKKP